MSRVTPLLFALVLSLELRAALGQEPTPAASLPNEYSVKAAFLFNFGRYVQWPETAFAKPDDSFVIGIAGEYPFGAELDQIAAKKTIQGRRISIVRFATPDAYRHCNILFLSRSLSVEQADALINKTRGKSVLVVGENPGMAERGAAVNFYLEENCVRLEINSRAVRTSRLDLDAKLLALGKPVARG
jgi:hypothetical protein